MNEVFLSNPQDWYVITAGVCNHRKAVHVILVLYTAD